MMGLWITALNPYAAGGEFGRYKMMQKALKNDRNPGTYDYIINPYAAGGYFGQYEIMKKP